MNGSHLVKISRRRGTKYTFTIKRNITIVRGDSGTGKTTLFNMVADYMRTGEQSGVSLQCDCPCVALTDYDWRNQLSSVHDSIVFVDEGLKEIHSDEFAHHVLYSSNYFVLISRLISPIFRIAWMRFTRLRRAENTILSSLFIKIAGIIVMLFPGRRQNRTFLSFYARTVSLVSSSLNGISLTVSLPVLRP